MAVRAVRVLTVNKLLCFALLAVILAAGNVAYQYRYLRPSDDYFWLMFLSNNYLSPAEGSELYLRYDDYLRENSYDDEALARAGVRRVLNGNYLAQGFFFVPFVLLVRDTALSVEQKTVIVMFGGFLSMYAAVSLLFLLVLWRGRDPNVAISVVLAALLIYFLDFTHRPQVYHHLHPGVLGVGILEQAEHFFFRLFHPGPKYVIFNLAPKDRLTVLVTLLLVLRWAGDVRLAYLLLPLLFLVHVEYAGLLVAMFVAMDLLIRPRAVMAGWIAPWAGLLLGGFVLFSALGRRLEVESWIAAMPVVLALLGMVAFRLADKALPQGGRRLCKGFGALVDRIAPPLQDLAAFAVVWLLLLPVTYAIYRLSGGGAVSDTPLDNTLWLLVPTRYLGLFAFAIVTALFWALLRLARVQVCWGAGPRWRAAALALLCVLVLVPAGVFALRQEAAPWTVALAKVGTLEDGFGQPLSPATWHTDEVRVYYAMFTTLVTGEDRLGRLGIR